MALQLRSPVNLCSCIISLPASKSISNRVLMIKALSEKPFDIENLSEASDTEIMSELLASNSQTLNVKDAGTVMRFMLAYAAITNGDRVITGTARMKDRPIAPLVDVLRALGANIEYLDKPGYPPVKVVGRKLPGKIANIQGNISSQFISALLMIAPLLPNGLELTIENNIVSRPYIEMTVQLMKHFGVNCKWTDNLIIVPSGKYQSVPITIEPDWSAASYFFSLVALNQGSEILLAGLKNNSLQGDRMAIEIFQKLGVSCKFSSTGISLCYTTPTTSFLQVDFTNIPDLAQTVIVAATSLGIPGTYSGLQTLRLKETDRIIALQNELLKIGADIKIEENTMHVNVDNLDFPDHLKINTYGDHRMAMSFAPVVTRCNTLEIDNPQVVVKSFPGFWQQLQKTGIRIPA